MRLHCMLCYSACAPGATDTDTFTCSLCRDSSLPITDLHASAERDSWLLFALQRRWEDGGRLKGGDARAGTLPLPLPPPGELSGELAAEAELDQVAQQHAASTDQPRLASANDLALSCASRTSLNMLAC